MMTWARQNGCVISVDDGEQYTSIRQGLDSPQSRSISPFITTSWTQLDMMEQKGDIDEISES